MYVLFSMYNIRIMLPKTGIRSKRTKKTVYLVIILLLNFNSNI